MAAPIPRRWRTILVSVIVAYGVLMLVSLGFIYSGFYDIGADRPHWGLVSWMFETARGRSIQTHAAEIAAPGGLDDQKAILTGAEHFADHCAVCHGAPGVPKGDIANGLYPQPPDLATTVKHYTAGELFWIIKHGIKMTGMPSWGGHTDDELWATVSFIQKLPGMTEQDYLNLVKQAMSQGHNHAVGPETPAQRGGTGLLRGATHE